MPPPKPVALVPTGVAELLRTMLLSRVRVPEFLIPPPLSFVTLPDRPSVRQKSKVKSQKNQKGTGSPKFIYGERKKCISSGKCARNTTSLL